MKNLKRHQSNHLCINQIHMSRKKLPNSPFGFQKVRIISLC